MGRSVLVTGGNRGIGLAIARAFAENGDMVTVIVVEASPAMVYVMGEVPMTTAPRPTMAPHANTAPRR